MTATLLAAGLVKRFDLITAVDGVSLEVWPGEIVGLLGPNGSGKTTLLRMLAGILTPTAGSVAVNGLPMTEHPLTAKRRIGFLSGDTQLYQRLTPREVLYYFGRLYGMANLAIKNRVDQLVGELEMIDFVDRPCRTLSSGQKQRANLARTFLHQPDVLLLDEPTAALDVISGDFISTTIRRERAAGRAVVLSTHIMSEAEYLCDRLCLLHQGRAVEQGTLAEILARASATNLTDAFLSYVGRSRSAPTPGEG